MRDRRPRTCAALLVASCIAGSALRAQDAIGHLDDASTPPRGLLRLRTATAWTRYDHVFVQDSVAPLGGFLTAPALGASNRFAQLAGIETWIQSAAASPFTLSLGRSRLDATGREEVVPIGLEYGITDKIAVGVTIPIVRKRVATLFRLDTTGSPANVGPNPGRTSSAATAVNGNVQTQFAAAATQLQTKLSSCQSNPSGAGCAALLARQSEVQPLVQSSQSFASTIAALYGGSGGGGAAFVPTAQSAAQAAIALRVADFNAKYKDLLASSTDLLTVVPIGAGGPAGPADFERYVVNDLGRDSINTQERVGIGDVELAAKIRVLDYVSPSRTRSAQLAVAASVRLPTGSSQSPSEIVDMRLGNGAATIDGRLFFDGQVGRFGLLLASQFATSLAHDSVLQTSPGVIERWPPYGRQRVEVQVAPRWHLSAPLSVHAAYSMRFTEAAGDQLLGGGVTYSTLSTFKRGAALPIEMRFTHLEAIKGEGNRPKFFRDQIEVRLYRRLR